MKTSLRGLVIVGCGGHARSAADIVLETNPECRIVFVDGAGRPGEVIMGFPVLTSYPETRTACFVGIGDNARREQASNDPRLPGKVVSVIAQSSHISHSAILGEGLFVGQFAHIGPEAKVGRGTIVNDSAVVEHEATVGMFCHVAANATLLGRARLGDRVFLGAGAVVRDGVTVCADVTIGMGTIVAADISEPGVYVGVPARRLRC